MGIIAGDPPMVWTAVTEEAVRVGADPVVGARGWELSQKSFGSLDLFPH